MTAIIIYLMVYIGVGNYLALARNTGRPRPRRQKIIGLGTTMSWAFKMVAG